MKENLLSTSRAINPLQINCLSAVGKKHLPVSSRTRHKLPSCTENHSQPCVKYSSQHIIRSNSRDSVQAPPQDKEGWWSAFWVQPGDQGSESFTSCSIQVLLLRQCMTVRRKGTTPIKSFQLSGW